ncbi:putative mitochondrial calcium-translocating P-type ATPase [Leptomonas pyrrhocoris]|uniref:Calcium-transporting ATPase n=1 Tax=Leptomonas pyrrhocoris TaxID=157538 RepID=A0A0M9FP56_LEPPY|nr:putative mitochondrial calcium-translocating P-type ATPase [Leptomonas pyrrhocoris]KPA73157.1 putative mitochondrial calcium-translocating P-type ATPase [Leptomonas pyrrhocoris]|eukprot:XP_015651596.1 putative mitochondrial calcium-translocating P-type ATPase [Leptomonas pyrrhocoris]
MSNLLLPDDPSAMASKVICKQLEVDESIGLTETEAKNRLLHFGKNEFPAEPPTPFWKLVAAQFDDMLVRILLMAALISFITAVLESNLIDFVEPFIILLILTLNAIVGVWQENRADQAIDALKDFVPETAVVIRSGAARVVLAENLVPGDVVEIAVGDRVPADMRVLALESTTLRVDQSILNGESVETMKQVEAVHGKRNRFPASMVYRGTAVVYGKARGVVVRTGISTEIGAIERDVREQEETKTPLQLKLDEFGVLLSRVIGYICLLVFVVNTLHWFKTHTPAESERWFERYIHPVIHSLKVAVALAVAAIPEGLPAVVTTCLALGTRKMAQHNALVRDLPSVETLGRCTVICSDKTGTLTTNMMSVAKVVTAESISSLRTYDIHDSKFNVVPGAVSRNGALVENVLDEDAAVDMLATVAVLCNDASLSAHGSSGDAEKIGEATEAALLTMSEKLAQNSAQAAGAGASLPLEKYRAAKREAWRKDATLEFTRSRKSMSTCCTSTQDARMHALFVKGAPEKVLKRCSRLMLSNGQIVPLKQISVEMMTGMINHMSGAEDALRCIAFAFRPIADPAKLDLSDPAKFESVESDLTFVGFCGMLDPPRQEVADAIAKCRTAGIRVVVITGDKKETAEAVCRKIGLLAHGATAGLSFTGDEFDQMSLAEKRLAVHNGVLFSRTDPSHKMQLVNLLQDEKLICAMTGDGVNDSPALKKADIGIAMGSGTEVAKAASKMVLADDNFATVVKAVREGRTIFNNTKQFIRYLISSNIGEVACVLATGLCGLPEALSPIQLLWVNLVTDGLPATALGFNEPDPDIMEQAPRRVDEPIVGGWLFFRYMVVGVYIGLATVAGFVWWFITNGFTWTDIASFTTCVDMQNEKCVILANPEAARSIALSILVVVEMLNALNALSENQSLVVTRPSTNKWLIAAIASSIALHLTIMYIPFFATLFGIAPLGVDPEVVAGAQPWEVLIPTDFTDWKMVLVLSMPVIFIDEFMKWVSRGINAHHTE